MHAVTARRSHAQQVVTRRGVCVPLSSQVGSHCEGAQESQAGPKQRMLGAKNHLLLLQGLLHYRLLCRTDTATRNIHHRDAGLSRHFLASTHASVIKH